MSSLDATRARFRLLFARRAAESRVNEEIGFHIDMEADRLERDEGLTPTEARRRALVAFGGVEQHKEALRDDRGLAWLGGLTLDGKLAIRMLIKQPALTLVAVLGMSVAVAIGAVTFSGIYTMIDGTLPVSEGDRVIGIRNLDTRSFTDGRLTHLHDLATWRETLTTVEELGAYRIIDRNLITPKRLAESMAVAEMTASGFRIARVPPLVGRYFNDDDERAGAPPVVVIGYDVWQTRFAGRRDIVGQPVQLGDVGYSVIGVMPRGFAFPVNNRLWTPLRLDPAHYERGEAPAVEVFGRLAPNASIDDVRRQITTIGQRLADAYPQTHANLRTRVIQYTRTFIDNPETTWLFQLAQLLVTMLLVVIGTNVAILVYARTASRMGEIAIRTALGASRARVVAQLFAEALALSTIAAGVGLAIAHVALLSINEAIERVKGDAAPFWLRFHITPGVVLYCGGLAVLAAVIVGVVPALKATGRHVRSSLQHLSAGSSGMRLGKTWTLLIIAQITVAVAVLPVAIAGISAWKRLRMSESALAKKQILVARLVLDHPDVPSTAGPERQAAVLRETLAERLRAEPGVSRVALASTPPGEEAMTRIEIEGTSAVRRDSATRQDESGAVVGATSIDPEYLATFDIPVLSGRAFRPSDYATMSNAVIVNRSFARKLFGGGNPLGHRLRVVTSRRRGGRDTMPVAAWEEIVGVVPDFPVDSSTPDPKIYRPLSGGTDEPVAIALRMNGYAAASYANRLRELTTLTSPMLRLGSIKPLDQTLNDQNVGDRLLILSLELVTLSTVLLSAAGIYALVSFTIARRRREIGIRSALGAGVRHLLVTMLSRVFLQVGIGIAVGTALAGVLDRLLGGGWTGRRPELVLPSVVALMAVVALFAALGPAARATRIHPTEALRSE